MSAATVTIMAGVAMAVKTGTDLYAAHKASEANKQALAAQTTASDKALAYEKERDQYARTTEANRYGAMMSQTEPYRQTGTGANRAMASFLGLPAPSTPVQQAQPAVASAAGAMGAGPNAPNAGAMVMMRAPNGQTKQVPAHQVDHWTKLGAVQVG